jgi:hypothetical protein
MDWRPKAGCGTRSRAPPAFALQTAGKNAIERLAESVTKPAFALQTAGNADFS